MKNIWLVIVLGAAGAVVLLLLSSHKPESGTTVAMQDVFSQTPEKTQAPSAPAAVKLPSVVAPVADPVRAPAIVTSPENGHEAGFAVQVYSFQDRIRAEKALAGLKQNGYKAFMEVSDLGPKGTWYRVRVGGLNNESQAQAMLDEIRKNYKSGFIVKPKQL